MLYLDCFSGASGDMILGALLDLGLPLDALKSALGSLAIEYGDVTTERVLRAGVTATKLRLTANEPGASGGHAHHHLKHIAAAIRRSALKPESRDRAVQLFERLAEAEASIHNVPIERVHLHEVGALDSIIDIVGAVYGFEWFGIDDIVSSPLNVGGGTVECAHGTFPVPAPATARLLAGVPIYGDGTTEMVTPTGALLVSGYAREYGPLPAMAIEKIGYGAGDRDPKEKPNVLRIMKAQRVPVSDFGTSAIEPRPSTIGPRPSAIDHSPSAIGHPQSAAAHRPSDPGSRPTDHVVKMECEIDDMNPQLFGPLMDGLLAGGALDVFYIPVQMKKGRPGTLVTILARPADRQALADIVFRESTTIGIRYEEMRRMCLDRSTETVETPYGPIRFKVAKRDGHELNAAPEFDDCARAAADRGVSIKVVQSAAIHARQAGT
ncbi:MAG: nickel pincer cofactor biosynthesis protein LarC [Vicinamibacterales bacterium]